MESYAERAPAGLDGARPAARRTSTTLDALRALFPAGSMTGAPKLRTMEIIDEVESDAARGLRRRVRLDLRRRPRRPRGRDPLAVRERIDGGWRYELGTGGGITVRSDVDEE